MSQCTAKSKRSGVRCKKHAVVGRAVCHIHGGKTPKGKDHYNYQGKGEGQYLPIPLREMYQAFINDPDRLSLDKNIATLDVRSAQLLMSLIEGGNPAELWNKLRKQWVLFWGATEREDAEGVTKYRNGINEILTEGLQEVAAWDEYRENVELRRKLADTEGKQMERSRQVLTARQAMALVQALILAIEEEVIDGNTRSRIGKRFDRITTGHYISAIEPADRDS